MFEETVCNICYKYKILSGISCERKSKADNNSITYWLSRYTSNLGPLRSFELGRKPYLFLYIKLPNTIKPWFQNFKYLVKGKG